MLNTVNIQSPYRKLHFTYQWLIILYVYVEHFLSHFFSPDIHVRNLVPFNIWKDKIYLHSVSGVLTWTSRMSTESTFHAVSFSSLQSLRTKWVTITHNACVHEDRARWRNNAGNTLTFQATFTEPGQTVPSQTPTHKREQRSRLFAYKGISHGRPRQPALFSLRSVQIVLLKLIQ